MNAFIETFESRTLMSVTPVIPADQKANLQKLARDLSAIHAKSDVTTTQIQKLVTDVKAVLQVAHKPSAESVSKLKADTKAAFADKKLTVAEHATLYADTQAVLTSAGVPSNLSAAVRADLKAIITASHVTVNDVKLIVSDWTAIVNTFKANHP